MCWRCLAPRSRGSTPQYPPRCRSTTIAPRKTRTELRAERKRQRRRRLGAGGIAAIVVAVLIAAAVGGFFAHQATSGSSAPKDPESTLLVTMKGSDGNAIATLLAAHDVKAKQGLELLVPSRLITDADVNARRSRRIGHGGVLSRDDSAVR